MMVLEENGDLHTMQVGYAGKHYQNTAYATYPLQQHAISPRVTQRAPYYQALRASHDVGCTGNVYDVA